MTRQQHIAGVLVVAAIWCGVDPVVAHRQSSGRDPARTEAAVGMLTQPFERTSATWGPRHLLATIWYPVSEPGVDHLVTIDAPPSDRGPFPVIVYSHGGCGGSPQAIAPLAKAIASVGFIVVQFPHPGSTADDCASEGVRYAQGLLERPDDIVAVLDGLQHQNAAPSWALRGRVDTSRVGIIGHSQGGQTALMMPSRDSRVRATLSISPSVAHRDTPSAVWEAIAIARVPTMILHGTRDALWSRDGPLKAYATIPTDVPRAFLEIEGMEHTPNTPDVMTVIVRYATALFRYYVQGDAAARALLEPKTAPPLVAFTSSRFP